MNNMTATEANRNFTAATKLVEENGILMIQKSGKDKYVLMTKERYESMGRNIYCGRRGEDLIKVEVNGKTATVYSIWLEDGKLEHMVYKIIETPADRIELTKKGNSLKVSGDLSNRRPDEKISVTDAEAFLDENEKCVFLPEEPTSEPDIFEANLIKRAVEAAKDILRAEEVHEVELSIERNGKELMQSYLEEIEGR